MTPPYTKHLFSLGFIVAATTLLLSCGDNSEQTTTQQPPQVDSTLSSTESVHSSNQSELLRLIISPQGGELRGFKLGDPISKIRTEEKFELFEDSTDHVGFTYETDNFEAIDILYYLDKNKALSSIRVDVYLNDAKAVEDLIDQFDTFLSGKYIFDKKQGKTATWKGKAGLLITLEDVTKDKDYGLRLGIGAKGSKALAI